MAARRERALAPNAVDPHKLSSTEKMERARLRLQVVQTCASLISMTAIVIAYYQFQEGERREEQSVYRTISTDWNEHLRFFVDKPEFRPYFFEAKPVVAGDPNADAVYAVADVRIDLMDSILAHMNARGWSEEETEGWRSTFRDAFSSSPVLCAEIAKTSAHFALVRMPAKAGCQQLKLERSGHRKPVISNRATSRRKQ
jgi:hypothetical protein